MRKKKCFLILMYMDNHQDGRLAIWSARPALVQSQPAVSFVPPYAGHRGWLGVQLDKRLATQTLAELILVLR
ncbi:hypothetical protein [Meiothermus sp.]|uniref:hypothetical protein n=1 Tax=Meiothermus sp. TaxID=1955249 RepID=UPI00307F90E0